MTRIEIREVLELLKEVLSDASILQTADDDPSGIRSKYLVDHEQLMKNIEDKIERLEE